jgi:hypothetical protein
LAALCRLLLGVEVDKALQVSRWQQLASASICCITTACVLLLGIEVDKTLQVGHSLHLATAQVISREHCAVCVGSLPAVFCACPDLAVQLQQLKSTSQCAFRICTPHLHVHVLLFLFTDVS